MEKNTLEIVKQNEEMFQNAWEHFWHQETKPEKQKHYWDIMFKAVYFACCNIGKTKCYGIRVQDLEGKCLDAACKIMEDVGEGRRPKKLSSYAYLYVVGQIWNKKHIEWERSEDLSSFENYATEIDDDGNVILCKSSY